MTVPRRARLPGGRLRSDAGVTIVELVIALVIVLIAFAALASTLVTSLASARNAEARVRAVSVANQLLEEMAGAPWNQMGMAATDDEAIDEDIEQLIDMLDASPVVLPSTANPILPSPLSQEFEEFEVDGHVYRVQRWVTWAEEDGQPELKRSTVSIAWSVGTRDFELQRDALRAPEPADLRGLDITVTATSQGASQTGVLIDEGGLMRTGGDYAEEFEVTVLLGPNSIDSSVRLEFPDRSREIVSIPESGTVESGEPAERTWRITPGPGYAFRHGITPFTVYVTADVDGQVVSDTAELRFYQPVVIEGESLQVSQNGEVVEVVDVAETGEVCGQISAEIPVRGMTDTEALGQPDDDDPDGFGEGGLRLEWQDAGEQDHEVRMRLAERTSFGGVFVGVVETLGSLEVPEDNGETIPVLLRIEADRITPEGSLFEDGQPDFDDFDEYEFTIDVRVVTEC